MTRLIRIPLLAAFLLAIAPAGGVAQTSPDPFVALPSQISAVLDAATRPRIVIVAPDHGVSTRRELAVGEIWRDGWRLASVANGKVTFRKGSAERSVVLPDKLAEPALPAPRPVSGPVSLTNSLVGGTPGTHGLTSVSAAITAGDAEAVRALGGAPEDTLAAMQVKARTSNNGQLAFLQRFGDTSDGSTITEGEADGQPALIKVGPDGRPTGLITGAMTATITQARGSATPPGAR